MAHHAFQQTGPRKQSTPYDRAMKLPRIWSLLLVSLAFLSPSSADADAKRPVELGDVPWIRDFEAATEKAKKTGLPILLLFQEVPG